MSDRVDLTPTDDRTPEELAGASGPHLEGPELEEPAGTYGPAPEIEEGPLNPLDDADVRRWLERVGWVTAWALPAVDDDYQPEAWRFTEEELGELTPPLTRVLNRRAAWLRGVIRNTDEIEVGFLLLEYVTANLERARAAKSAPTEEPADHLADLEEGHPDRGPANFGLGDLEG